MTKIEEKYLTYTVIARKCGLSVPALKATLAKKGYLRLHEPTEKALRSRLVIMKDADPDHPYASLQRSRYPVWNEIRVIRMLKRSGQVQDPRFRTGSYEKAAENLCEVGFELARHFGYVGDTCDFTMASYLVGAAGQSARALAFEMSHGAVWAKSAMHDCERLDDACEGLDELLAYARTLGRPSTKHLENAKNILSGIDAFLMRQK